MSRRAFWVQNRLAKIVGGKAHLTASATEITCQHRPHQAAREEKERAVLLVPIARHAVLLFGREQREERMPNGRVGQAIRE